MFLLLFALLFIDVFFLFIHLPISLFKNSMGKNRFAFDESSKGVMGPTLGLELSAGLGKKKKVQNLTKPIRLVIPNIDPLPVPESHTAYCELMRVVHLVKCDVNTSSLFLKMKPKDDNFTGNLFAFMNKG